MSRFTQTDKIQRPCTEVIAALNELGRPKRWLHEETLALLRKRGETLPGGPNFSRLINGKAALSFNRAIAIADVLEHHSGGRFKLANLFPEIEEMSAIGELQVVALVPRTRTLTPPRQARSVLLQPQGGQARFTTDGTTPLPPARHRLPHGRIIPDLHEKILPLNPGQEVKIQLANPESSVNGGVILVYEWREV